jgi:hypothetical protein
MIDQADILGGSLAVFAGQKIPFEDFDPGVGMKR